MIANSQSLLRFLAIGMALALGACAKGASTFDDTVNGSSGSGASTTCGNGMIDLNTTEQCEPSLALTMTCASLMAGTGTVSCSRVTCRFDTSMCSAGAGVGGTGH